MANLNTYRPQTFSLSGNVTAGGLNTTGVANVGTANVTGTLTASNVVVNGGVQISGITANVATNYPVFYNTTTNQISRSIKPIVNAYYSNATQTFTWGSVFAPNTESVDTGNIYNTSNGIIAPTVAGWYKIGTFLWVQSASTAWYMQLSKSGNQSAANAVVLTGGLTSAQINWYTGSGFMYFNGTTDTAVISMYPGLFSGTDTVETKGVYFNAQLTSMTIEWISP